VLRLEPGDLPGARLKSELETRRLKLRRMRIGLARPLLTVKALELPPARGAQLAEMVAFELERHVPFPPEECASTSFPCPAPRKVRCACWSRPASGARSKGP